MPNFSLKDQVVFEAARQFATPFHLYSERGIRQTARALKDAFGEIEDFREYFAVKALPTPAVLRILKEEGCGVDCASATELMLADACGFQGGDIMFSANDVTGDEFALARRLGAYINLDDITHIDFLKDTIGSIPKRISCRYNPGGTFTLGESEEGFQVMDNPGQAKYGLTRPQMTEAFRRLKELGAERFGIHVTFSKPNKDTFLHIVRHLAEENGIDMPTQELELLAERFALERGNRSARLARQFIDGLLSKAE